MNWIVFALHGEDPRYTGGLFRNIDLVRRHYGPGWAILLYHDLSVPATVIAQARASGLVALRRVDEPSLATWAAFPGRFWRLLALTDPLAQDPGSLVCFRDIDSRVSPREVAAVMDWHKSGRRVHIMRDHPHHSARKMLAGMWGRRVTDKSLKWVLPLAEQHFQDRLRKGVKAPWSDDYFLGRAVYPKLKKVAWEHDSFAERPFPEGVAHGPFVGEIFFVLPDGSEQHQMSDRVARNKAVDKLNEAV